MTAPGVVVMSRWQAAALHLAAGIIVVAAALLAPMLLWSPPALWPIAGLERPLLLLFAAVLVAGPLLTLLVFRAGKRTLRSDLIVVVLIQLAFLGYALYMLSRIRPVFMVAAADHLQLVRAIDIDRADLAEAGLTDRQLSWTGPRLVGLRTPAKGGRDLLLAALAAGDHPQQPVLHVPYADAAPGLLQQARPLDALMARSARDRATVTAALASLHRSPAQVRYVPVTSRHGAAVMLIDGVTGTPLRALRLDP